MTTAEAMSYLGIRADGLLAPCPSTRSAVGSCFPEDKKHYLPPLAFDGSVIDAKERLKAIMQSLSSIELVQEEGRYLHFERESLVFRIISDVEFLVDEERQLIHFRSALRYGAWDLGANARLIKRVREIFRNLAV